MARLRNPQFLILAAVAFLGLLHAPSFTSGWFGEDYAWLAASADKGWSILLPSSGAYFRPLSVNLPYLAFSSTPGVWAALGWFTLLVSTEAIYLWLAALGVETTTALLFALVWLVCPSQLFALYYRNAFDYLAFPCLLLLFLLARARRRNALAFVLFLLACLTKEMAYALPLFFLAGRRSYAWFAAGMVAVASLLAIHRGFSPVTAGGFAVVTSLSGVGIAVAAFVHDLLLGLTDTAGSIPWHLLAWSAAAGMIFSARRKIREAASPLWPFVFLFLPLTFLVGIHFEHLGLVFFPALFAFSGRLAAAPPLRLARGGIVLSLVFAAFLAPVTRARQWIWYSRFHQFADAAEPYLKGCEKFDRVIAEGVDALFPTPEESEHALWALRLNHPGVFFYLLGNAASARPVPGNESMWVTPPQAAGHVRLAFSLDRNGNVSVRSLSAGRNGCGKIELLGAKSRGTMSFLSP